MTSSAPKEQDGRGRQLPASDLESGLVVDPERLESQQDARALTRLSLDRFHGETVLSGEVERSEAHGPTPM
ncbi:hypothetical protein CBD41_07390 [bacterium TMED181]|nr:hypothetical protein [Planctomycetota bacterium]OUW43295.1 MAG: hypothetical protein CBD41_07390 [bacterium TMED181]